jgi:hypothetical protein
MTVGTMVAWKVQMLVAVKVAKMAALRAVGLRVAWMVDGSVD